MNSLCAQRRLRSDRADAKTDLNHRWGVILCVIHWADSTKSIHSCSVRPCVCAHTAARQTGWHVKSLILLVHLNPCLQNEHHTVGDGTQHSPINNTSLVRRNGIR